MLVVNIGPHPLRYSSLGIVRSLGSIGVPVYVISPGRLYPDAVSRFATGHLDWRTTGLESSEALSARIGECAAKIGCRPIAICTDDEGAVLLAERGTELGELITAPDIDPSLTRSLASKRGLLKWCQDFGVLVPKAAFPRTHREIEDFAEHSPFPIVAKNVDPFTRLRQPAVPSTYLIEAPHQLLSLASAWEEPYEVLLQEYMPRESAEDWFVHAYAASSTDSITVFTGQKIRSYPPFRGVTSYGIALPNNELAEMGEKFLRDINYRGAADLDWRRDLRDGGYRLLDFNPRIGAQFRVFQSSDGTDIPRLMHLDLTGRPLPSVGQLDGRRFVVEHFDIASRLLGRPRTSPSPSLKGASASRTARVQTTSGRLPEFAWFYWRDPIPVAVAAVRIGIEVLGLLVHRKLHIRTHVPGKLAASDPVLHLNNASGDVPGDSTAPNPGSRAN